MWSALLHSIKQGDKKSLARAISAIENELAGYEELMAALQFPETVPVIGITGAPGAGKSTLVDALIDVWASRQKKVAVLCVDPSSPFHRGALLGDRIRMSRWYNHPNVYIRSLATRGAMGGLHPKIIEITDLLKAAAFDYIIVETVGVGQSEIEIAGLADSTVVVLVPEAGDEIQTMKAGLMEIATLFVVNKSDRPEADAFVQHLRKMLAPAFAKEGAVIPILKTVATEKKGLPELAAAIEEQLLAGGGPARKAWLLAEKAYQMIQSRRMKDITKMNLQQKILEQVESGTFNLYQFVNAFR